MQFEKWVDLNLDKGHAAVADLGPIFYTGDSKPLKMGVKLRDSSGDVAVTGGVSGWAIQADGNTCSPFEGDKSGNMAWILVPQAALSVPGRVEIFLRLTDSDEMAVSLYATGTVKRTTTGTIINPGTVIPNVSELTTAASQCVAATAAAQAIVDDWEIATVAETQSYLGIA